MHPLVRELPLGLTMSASGEPRTGLICPTRAESVEKVPGIVNSGSRMRFAKREARDHVWRSLSNRWPSQRDYDLMQRDGCSDDFVSTISARAQFRSFSTESALVGH